MKKYRLLVDPPSGYLYGFPKVIPEEFTDESGDKIEDREGFNEWLSDHYPLEIFTMRFIKEVL